MQKTFEIMYNSLDPKVTNKIKRPIYHVDLETKQELKQIKLVKLEELPNALYPNNIVVGYEKTGVFARSVWFFSYQKNS